MTETTALMCAKLTDLAAQWTEEAKLSRRARIPIAEEIDRAAMQLRFVRLLVNEGIYDTATGYAWLHAGRRMLHEVRADRREITGEARA